MIDCTSIKSVGSLGPKFGATSLDEAKPVLYRTIICKLVIEIDLRNQLTLRNAI